MSQAESSMPRRVAKRIMRRAAKGERALVLVIKNGKPSRVYGLTEYQERQDLTKKVKPWERRKKKAAAPDPLGAVDGAVVAPLGREKMYE